MYKILVVDDEANIRKLIVKYANFEGYEVVEASDGAQAVSMCRSTAFDLIVMDIMMPGMDGLTACTKIKDFSDVPIIMLSARGEEYDKIYGFRLGIDDYVVKPFSPKELMLRIQAVLKRCAAGEMAKKKEIYQCEGLTVDFTGRMVYVNDKPVEMSPKEYDLLFYMVRNRGIALTREKLINEVWGYDYYGDARTLDTHIKLLRKSLGPCSAGIVTLRGVGYRFALGKD
ncbi:MAG: response regulator transcription factor [Oscillospiraceae bacterium]|nr:response regulator transcription factor [Oscillospiraceae bacterium]